MWRTVKLGDVCELAYGKSLDKSERLDRAGYPAFGANGIRTQSKVPLYDKPSIIIGRKGSAGEINKVTEPFWALDVTYYTKIDENVITLDYLFYVLTTLNLPSLARGVKPGINRNDVYDQTIPLPPLAEQQRIVAKLDAAFAEIDKAIIVSEEAYSKARNLYQQELSNTFSDSNEGWIDTTIGECCSLKSGNTLNKNLEQDVGEVPYLKVADMNLMANISGITTSSRFVSKTSVSEKAIIKSGSVIFPKRGGAIATNKKRLTLVDICADLNIMSVQPNRSILSELLFYYFQNIDMAKLGSGSSIPQINNYDIEPLRISYPNEAEKQRDLINHLSSIESLSEKLAQTYLRKIHELLQLKSAILAQELQPPQSEAA